MSTPLKKRIGLTILDRLIRVGTFGDSTSVISGSPICPLIYPTDTVNSVTLDLTTSDTSPQHQYIDDILWVADGGISGQNITKMLNRSSSAYSTTRKSILDVLEQKPDFVLLHAGSINDRSLIVNESGNELLITSMIEAHLEIARIFVESGVTVLDSGLLGYDNSGISAGLLQERRSWITQLNAAVKAESANHDNWAFIDVNGVISTNGQFLTGMSADGIHLTALGEKTLADLEIEEIRYRFASKLSYPIINDSLYRFKNPSSDIPLGYTLRNKGSSTFSGQNTTASKFSFTVTAIADNASFAVEFPYQSIVAALGLPVGTCVFAKSRIRGPSVPMMLAFRFDEYTADNSGRVIHGAQKAYWDGSDKIMRMQYTVSNTLSTAGNYSLWCLLISGLPVGVYSFTLFPDLFYKIN